MKEWRPDDWIGRGGIVPNAALNPVYKPEYIDERIKAGQLYEAGASAMLSALLKWLDEPCDKHVQSSPYIGEMHSNYFPEHRYLCPQCMAELRGDK